MSKIVMVKIIGVVTQRLVVRNAQLIRPTPCNQLYSIMYIQGINALPLRFYHEMNVTRIIDCNAPWGIGIPASGQTIFICVRIHLFRDCLISYGRRDENKRDHNT